MLLLSLLNFFLYKDNNFHNIYFWQAGDIDHLAATFLVAHNIAHGINLRKSPVLQYLYYLAQVLQAISIFASQPAFLFAPAIEFNLILTFC